MGILPADPKLIQIKSAVIAALVWEHIFNKSNKFLDQLNKFMLVLLAKDKIDGLISRDTYIGSQSGVLLLKATDMIQLSTINR